MIQKGKDRHFISLEIINFGKIMKMIITHMVASYTHTYIAICTRKYIEIKNKIPAYADENTQSDIISFSNARRAAR